MTEEIQLLSAHSFLFLRFAEEGKSDFKILKTFVIIIHCLLGPVDTERLGYI